MMLRNTPNEWGSLAKSLHWIVAALVIFLLAYGWWMAHLAPRSGRLGLYELHSSIGYDLLFLVILRLLWRVIDRAPALPADLKRWEMISARAGHFLLYLLVLAVSVTGWLLLGTFSRPVAATLFQSIPVPVMNLTGDRMLHGLFEKSHAILSYALLALIVVHVLAALRHHFIKKNDILRRMWRHA